MFAHGYIAKPDIIILTERGSFVVLWFLPQGIAPWLSFSRILLQASDRTPGMVRPSYHDRLALVFVAISTSWMIFGHSLFHHEVLQPTGCCFLAANHLLSCLADFRGLSPKYRIV